MTTVRITDAGGNKPTFVQWDVDRVLYVSGVASQPCLHFASAELKRAIVVEATDDNGRWKCLVPNFILQFALPVIVSVFTQPEGGEGRTEATVVIGVQPKKKPQDYTYEENIGYINWVEKSAEVQALIDDIQGKLDRGELKGDKGDTGATGPTGPQGLSGVYIGSTAPSDPGYTVWIDTSGSADIGDEIYWANTLTDTYSDLQAAYNAGKQIMLRSGNIVYSLFKADSTKFQFAAVLAGNSSDSSLGFAYISCLASTGWGSNYLRVIAAE